MGFLTSRPAALLLLVVAAATASIQTQQPLLPPGYAKDVQPFADYNLPFVPRAPLWRRAALIQSPQYEHSMLLVDYPHEQSSVQQQPSNSAVDVADGQQPRYEHSMLQIDNPPAPQEREQADEQLGASSTVDMADAQQPQYEHSRLQIDHPHPPVPPSPPRGQQQQPVEIQPDNTSSVNTAGPPEVPNGPSGLMFEHPVVLPPPPPRRQQLEQLPASGGVIVPNEPIPPPSIMVPRIINPQVQMAPSQLPQNVDAVYYIDGPALQKQVRPFIVPVQSDGPSFRTNEPFPALSPPPVYSSDGPAPWGGRPVPISTYPELVKEQQTQQEYRPSPSGVVQPISYPDNWNVDRRGESVPVGMQQQMGGPMGNIGMQPYVVDRMGPVPYPEYGRMGPPVEYDGPRPEYDGPAPVERTDITDAQLGEENQPQETEKEKDNSQEEDSQKHEEESNEDTIKDLKDAVDVEEEVVPALVVFLRKKGHKALHDKDSVGIPGKEDRFRRSPGGGSSSSSHSSSSSSSSSGPVYFGDGGSGSYSSSSSQSSASSSSGGGAPLGFGASGPGLGGSFHGGAHLPSSGYGATGLGGSAFGGNYGGIGSGGVHGGLGATGYGGGHGGSYGGSSGLGGSGYGTTGYDGGYGSSGYGGAGCATCGGDGNVLLNRFGEADAGSGPFTVGGSGVSTGKGVHASSSSSIDSTGKVTYTAFAGKH